MDWFKYSYKKKTYKFYGWSLKTCKKEPGKGTYKIGNGNGECVKKRTAQPTYELLLIIVDHWVH